MLQVYEVTIFLNWSTAVILTMVKDTHAVKFLVDQLFPIQPINVCPGIVSMRFIQLPAACESDQKLVVPLVIPLMVAVPGLAVVLRMFPVEGMIFPVIAWTLILLMIRPALEELVFVLVNVTVILEVVTTRLFTVIAVPVAAAVPVFGINLQLVGAVRISVLLDWFFEKSLLAADLIVISPSVVHPLVIAFPALSAVMFVAHVPLVIVTAAYTSPIPAKKDIRKKERNIFLLVCIHFQKKFFFVIFFIFFAKLIRRVNGNKINFNIITIIIYLSNLYEYCIVFL